MVAEVDEKYPAVLYDRRGKVSERHDQFLERFSDAYRAELHYLKQHDLPVMTSAFPDVDFAPAAEAFGFQAATARTLDELRELAPLLEAPDGPILIDCKINASVAAPFMDEARRH